jgi:hypothetical protein
MLDYNLVTIKRHISGDFSLQTKFQIFRRAFKWLWSNHGRVNFKAMKSNF